MERSSKKYLELDWNRRILYLWGEYDPDFVFVIKKYLKGVWSGTERKWLIKLSLFDLLDLDQYIEFKLRYIFRFYSQDMVKWLISELYQLRNQVLNAFDGDDKAKFLDEIVVKDGLRLYRFQEEGVREILKRNGRILLADEMGLGKTVQVICYLNTAEKLGIDVFPVLIVCPAVVKWHWLNELRKWLVGFENKKVKVIEGRSDWVGEGKDIYIVNYDVISDYVDVFVKIGIKTVVLDECHYIKNRKARRTKSIQQIVFQGGVEKVLALSGTPLLNRPDELWTVLNLLRRDLFKSYWEFVGRYCVTEETKWGARFVGAKRVDELSELLRKLIMVRREKKDVLSELPEKMRVIIPVVVDIDDEFRKLDNLVRDVLMQIFEIEDKIEEGVVSETVLKKMKGKVWEIWREYEKSIEEYRIEVAMRKLDYVKEFVDNILEQNEKVVVYVYHRNIWHEMMKCYKSNAVGIVGGMSDSDKERAVRKFLEDDKAKVFVGSIRASGEGINLFSANKVVFLEYDWTPARLLQCEDRLHRIGQKDVVYSYWILLKNSFDEVIVERLLKKMSVIEKILDVKKREKFILLEELLKG